MNQATNQAGQAGEPPASPEIQPGERFIRIPEVMSMTGLKTSTIYRLQADSQFLRSVPLPGGRRAWLESEIRKFMQERVALREAVN